MTICLKGLAFVTKFYGSAISDALQDVAQVRDSLKSSHPDELSVIIDYLDFIDASIGPGTIDLPLNDLPSYSSALAGLRICCVKSDVWTNLYRGRIMLADTRLTVAIADILLVRVPEIVEQQTNPSPSVETSDWLSRLTKKVYHLVSLGIPFNLLSTDYVDSPLIKPQKFQDTAAELKKRKWIKKHSIKPTTLSYVTRIIQQWFDVPVPYTAHARSVLVGRLVDTVGAGCLLLPATWDVYKNLPSWLFTVDTPRQCDLAKFSLDDFQKHYLDDFAVTMQSHPGLHVMRECAQSLKGAYVALYDATRERRGQFITEQSRPGHLRAIARVFAGRDNGCRQSPVPDSNPCVLGHQVVQYIGAPPPRTTGVQAPSPAIKSALDNPICIQEVVRFLNDACHMVSAISAGNRPGDGDALRPHRYMYDKPDFLIPLRELAPSRARMNSGTSFKFLKTRQGLFSLLLFRSISYNSQAFLRCPSELRKVQFSDETEWLEYISDLEQAFPGEPDKFFCNPNAVSNQPIMTRTLGNCSTCWVISQTVSWPPPSESTDQFPVPFLDMQAAVLGWGSRSTTKLAGFGSLNEYLLLADMCAAGLVVMPSIAEMGEMICDIDKGAAEMLRLMGYLGPGKHKRDTVCAFEKFFAQVDRSLTVEQREMFLWNTVTTEHTLCKFKRMVRKKCYVI